MEQHTSATAKPASREFRRAKTTPEKIVVASDGGVASRAAMDWVIDRAQHVPVEVEVVTVEELEWLPVGADESDFRRKYDAVLAAAVERFANRHGVSFVSATLLAGEPADEILDAAEDADWLVVGSPRKSDDSGAPHGTLALRIAARTQARLVVIPAGWEPTTESSVVVGLDEENSSDAALEVAVGEASRRSSELVLVHAWSLPAPFSIVDGLLKTTYPSLEALHRKRIEEFEARAHALAPRLSIRSVVKFGSPGEVLAEAARDQALLVVGHRHRSRLEYLFLGSVGHRALLAAPAPVMIVPERA